MERQELLNKIAKLTEEIGKLPKGYISKKTISEKPIIIISGRKMAKSKAAICRMRK